MAKIRVRVKWRSVPRGSSKSSVGSTTWFSVNASPTESSILNELKRRHKNLREAGELTILEWEDLDKKRRERMAANYSQQNKGIERRNSTAADSEGFNLEHASRQQTPSGGNKFGAFLLGSFRWFLYIMIFTGVATFLGAKEELPLKIFLIATGITMSISFGLKALLGRKFLFHLALFVVFFFAMLAIPT